jgi:hypothetical protein
MSNADLIAEARKTQGYSESELRWLCNRLADALEVAEARLSGRDAALMDSVKLLAGLLRADGVSVGGSFPHVRRAESEGK